jgi:hypothetical protein
MASKDRSKQPDKVARRRYEPPAIEETGDFERLVLSCGHHPDDVDNEACGGPRTGMMMGQNS